jgi:hypothetical protein
MPSRLAACVLFLCVLHVPARAQLQTRAAVRPVDPIAAITEAFRTHDIVTLCDPHGNVQVQAFLLALVRDSRFQQVVNDIVLETASARYQDAIDRFVRGEEVEYRVLRQASEDHTVANSLGQDAEELIRAVRGVNASLPDGRRLRVIAGDPPIDWENVMSQRDHQRWIALRDSYPADLIRRQVLDWGRRALVVYGQGHLQRRQIVANYDMSSWQAQTVVSLLERDPAVHVLNIWTLLDRTIAPPEVVASWSIPSLAVLKGTTLGAADFGSFSRGLGDGTRFGVKNNQLVPLPRNEWKSMAMEQQFDALLYLGPPSAMTLRPVAAALCQDSEFTRRRLDRLVRFAPPVEADAFRKDCGL